MGCRHLRTSPGGYTPRSSPMCPGRGRDDPLSGYGGMVSMGVGLLGYGELDHPDLTMGPTLIEALEVLGDRQTWILDRLPRAFSSGSVRP